MEPIFNHDEWIGKTVGRRQPLTDALSYAFGLQKTLNQLGGMRFPRGVYRFKTHEAADAWLTDNVSWKHRD